MLQAEAGPISRRGRAVRLRPLLNLLALVSLLLLSAVFLGAGKRRPRDGSARSARFRSSSDPPGRPISPARSASSPSAGRISGGASRTSRSEAARPTVVWNLASGVRHLPERRTARLRATRKPLWVPWSAIEYYIPRQRILRLTSDASTRTPYSKGPECEKPPLVHRDGRRQRRRLLEARTIEVEHARRRRCPPSSLVARSKATRDSARVRFIREVEAGKHPRLPAVPTAGHPSRPRRRFPPPRWTTRPTSSCGRASRRRARVLQVDRIKGSGKPELDRAALLATYRSVDDRRRRDGDGHPRARWS